MSFYVHPVTIVLALSVVLHLARHGAHDEVGLVLSGRSDIALNAAGRDQAQRLAVRLRDEPIRTIFTSPRLRALETARAIASDRGLDPVAAPPLDEIDFGEWAGRTFEDLDDDGRWRTWNEDRRHAATPTGDTMARVTASAVAFVEAQEDADVAGGTAIVCVSHCDVIRALVVHYAGLDAERLLSFAVDPGSLTTIKLDGGSGRILAVNELSA